MLVGRTSNETIKNLFYVQYVALILIVLTVVIGSFLKPKFSSEKIAITENLPFEMKEKEIFARNETVNDFISHIETYASFFKEHNLKGEINIGFKIDGNENAFLNYEKKIRDEFMKHNINLNALDIYFDENTDANMVDFKIIRTNQYGLL